MYEARAQPMGEGAHLPVALDAPGDVHPECILVPAALRLGIAHRAVPELRAEWQC